MGRFRLTSRAALGNWGDLRIDGYIGGKQVISKSLSGRGVGRKFSAVADDTTLAADGADTTRVVLRVTDEFDAILPFVNDAVRSRVSRDRRRSSATIRFRCWRNRSHLGQGAGDGRQGEVDCHSSVAWRQQVEFDIVPAAPEYV